MLPRLMSRMCTSEYSSYCIFPKKARSLNLSRSEYISELPGDVHSASHAAISGHECRIIKEGLNEAVVLASGLKADSISTTNMHSY